MTKPIGLSAGGFSIPLVLAILELQLLQIFSEVGAELVALAGELERRLEEAQLVAGVGALAFEGVAVDLFLLEQLPQAVGELQFAGCAQFRGGEHLENCRCQDVASDNGQVRGRVPRTETSAANCRSRSPTRVRRDFLSEIAFREPARRSGQLGISSVRRTGLVVTAAFSHGRFQRRQQDRFRPFGSCREIA
jgi:hypothetical protein